MKPFLPLESSTCLMKELLSFFPQMNEALCQLLGRQQRRQAQSWPSQ